MASEYGPEFDRFVERARRELVPKIAGSDLFVSITPLNAKQVDIKFAVELGLAIMLDKPIVAVIPPGAHIPEKLSRVVDRFVELDLTDPTGRQRLEDTIQEMIGKDDDKS